MIFTASQFKNEIDVLEIRLETIGHLCDAIVLAEATVDQRGRPKDLVYPQHEARFSKWSDKIRYVVVDDMPGGQTHEDDIKRERHQRECLIRGMPDLQAGDKAYISDLDEIPSPQALSQGIAGAPLRFAMDLHVYSLNWRWLDRGCRIGTLGAVLRGEDILRQGVCQSVLWDSSVQSLPGISGWHLTYQGGVEAIRSKITGMMDKAANLVMPGMDPDSILTDEWIQESIDTGRDIFGRTYRQTEWVELGELPPIICRQPEKYAHMMVSKPANQDEIESQPRCSCGGIFDAERNLMHFAHCNLAGYEPALCRVVDNDPRSRPRSLDV